MRKILSGALALVILCASAMYCAHSRVLAVNATNNDKQLLARAVNGEARGEPYEGQVAVAAVILNRVRHSSFPNTISGVIYQPVYRRERRTDKRADRPKLNGVQGVYGRA